MSNTIQSNPNMIDLRADVGVWQRPNTFEDPYFDDENPAVDARAEYQQHQYVEALAQDDSFAVETAQTTPVREGGMPVNELERVPDANETQEYTTSTGNVVNPEHAEAVLAATANVVDAYAAAPAAQAERLIHEQHRAAVAQAGAYAPQLESIRDRALLNWGAGENQGA